MRASLSNLLALLSAACVTVAALPNPFSIPANGLSAKGGAPLDIKWTPTTSGTISLYLLDGNPADLQQVTTIASNITNDGSYSWTPSNSLKSADDYVLEIVDDKNNALVNYSPAFPIKTTGTATAASSSSAAVSSSSVSAIVTAPGPVNVSTSSSYSLTIHNTFTSLNVSSTSGLTVISGSSTLLSTTPSASVPVSTSVPPISSGGAARATAAVAGLFGAAVGALVF